MRATRRAVTGRTSMRSCLSSNSPAGQPSFFARGAQVAHALPAGGRQSAVQGQPPTRSFMQKSAKRGDTVDDAYAAGHLWGELRCTAAGFLARWSEQAAWDHQRRPHAAIKGSPGTFTAAAYLMLIIYLFTSYFTKGGTAARLFNTASDATAITSRARSLSPLASHVSPDAGGCCARRAKRPQKALQIAPAFSQESPLLPASTTPLQSNTGRIGQNEAEVLGVPADEPSAGRLSDSSGEAVQPPPVDSHESSFLTAQTGVGRLADPSEFGQPRKEQWVCRITEHWNACGWRQAEGRGPGWICPEGHCCSKTACKNGACGGGWCVDGGALCWIKDGTYEGGGCTCKSHGGGCSNNAICHNMTQGDGGAYCTCAPHFLGDGKNCKANPCQANPCAPGTCSPRDDTYACDCPSNTHELSATFPPACVTKKNPCMADPCGPPAVVDSCINFEVDHECICKEGYVSEGGVCEKVDWCKGDPCGPPNAVHDCISMGMGYKCYCQRGYTRQRDDEGLEYCQKDYCADHPCGTSELVKSCTNRVRKRAPPAEPKSESESQSESESESGSESGSESESASESASEAATEGYPRYSCLCSDMAELKTDEETLEGKCVRADPCKGEPCGPPEAVAQCFVQGLSYGCTCKPGYTAQIPEGSKEPKCVEGDPCVLKACGPDEFVENCTTDGKTYTCQCSEAGFMSLEPSGVQLCRSKALCEENCGPVDAVKQCTPGDKSYECVCKQGYLLAYNKGKRQCIAGDPCAVAPCGSPQAVAECRKEGDGYSCVCNRGFELRNRPDETQLCAEPQSCVGDPCGPVSAVELCLPGKFTYSCRCREPNVVREIRGRQHCTMAGGSSTGDGSRPFTDKEGKTESEEQQGGLLAGGVIVGAVLIGGAYAGIRYAKKDDQGTPESWDAEGGTFPGAENAPFVPGDPSGMLRPEHDAQDPMARPSPSAWG